MLNRLVDSAERRKRQRILMLGFMDNEYSRIRLVRHIFHPSYPLEYFGLSRDRCSGTAVRHKVGEINSAQLYTQTVPKNLHTFFDFRYPPVWIFFDSAIQWNI
jgi:hypothetical protein